MKQDIPECVVFYKNLQKCHQCFTSGISTDADKPEGP